MCLYVCVYVCIYACTNNFFTYDTHSITLRRLLFCTQYLDEIALNKDFMETAFDDIPSGLVISFDHTRNVHKRTTVYKPALPQECVTDGKVNKACHQQIRQDQLLTCMSSNGMVSRHLLLL